MYLKCGSCIPITNAAGDRGSVGSDEGFAATVSGEHTYYTNESNEEAYSFEFGITPALTLYLEGRG